MKKDRTMYVTCLHLIFYRDD